MTTISSLFSIGQSALMTQQQAIDIAGNNIANVNTPGYSRQELIISSGSSADTEIRRYYDQFISAQLSAETEDLGRWEAQKEALEKVELLFDDSGDYGLSNAMGEFWNAWQDLANDPSGTTERTSLISTGQYLALSINETYAGLGELQDDIDTQVDDIVGNVNDIVDQIADLNEKIEQMEVGGQNANAYRDERDQLVLELSELIDIQSFEDGNGRINVSVGNGKPLLDGTATWALSTADNGGVQEICWEGNDGTTVNITDQLSGGELKGLVEARDVLIPDYLARLDDMAGTIISEVNALHSSGTTLDSGTPTGVDFFTGTGAADIAVNSSIEANSDLIAAASAGEGVPGGNGIAMAIADLQSAATMTGGSTFDDYYNALVGLIGADVQAADWNASHQTTMVQSLETYQQEVSGVSLDEEMVKLVQFQQAYDAAAKFITTADEMLKTLLGML